MSRLDQLYRRLLLAKFFTNGWGQPDNLKRLFEFRKIISCRDKCKHLVNPDHPVHIDLNETHKDCRIIEGHFTSPFCYHLPGIMPTETETARFQMILPNVWPSSSIKPVCLHLAGTGDHYFWRRRNIIARPLLKEAGIASIILENPFYGVRKPKQQIRSSLQNVSDLFVMGGALVLESLVLFHWCEKQGFGPLGLTGMSMGGHMASLAATNWHKPVSLVPVLSWSTASSVFTEGVMSRAIPWKVLQEQYISNSCFEDEIAKLVVSPEENYENVAFLLGQRFARSYPISVSNMEEMQSNYNTAAENKVAKTNQSVNSAGATGYSSTSVSRSSPSTVVNGHSRVDGAAIPDWLLKLSRQSDSMASDSVLHFMRGIMDECTHIGNFSVPVDTSLIIVVVAKSDAYIPRNSVKGLDELWPGSEVRYVNSGHIAAFLLKQSMFRQAIIDAFNRQITKYYQ